MPINTKYPNLPDGFREAVRAARLMKGMSLRAAAKELGVSAPTMSQLELGVRNFDYNRAILFKNFFKMDFELPDVDFENAPKVTRGRVKHELKTDQFFVEIDGKLIKVMSYYEMGPVVKSRLVKENNGTDS